MRLKIEPKLCSAVHLFIAILETAEMDVQREQLPVIV